MRHKGRILLGFLVIAMVICMAMPCSAQGDEGGNGNVIYISIPGITEKCSDTPGREDSCPVHGIEERVLLTPGGSSRASAKPTINLMVTKDIDISTVKFLQMATKGQKIPAVILKFYRINPAGIEENYFTISLENAFIQELRHFTPEESGFPFHTREEIRFIFDKITWTWVPDGYSWSA